MAKPMAEQGTVAVSAPGVRRPAVTPMAPVEVPGPVVAQAAPARAAQARVPQVPERAVLAQEPVERVRAVLQLAQDQVPVRVEQAAGGEAARFCEFRKLNERH